MIPGRLVEPERTARVGLSALLTLAVGTVLW